MTAMDLSSPKGPGWSSLNRSITPDSRGANIYAELLGYGCTNDAYSITAPHPDGDGAARAITLALERRSPGSGRRRLHQRPRDQHAARRSRRGPGHQACVWSVWRSSIPVSSTKSMTGHLCAASGAIELIAITLAVRDGVVPPTINYETPDPACDLDFVPNTARELQGAPCSLDKFWFRRPQLLS